MYIPNANRMDDPEALLSFMQQHSFATLVSVIDGSPLASHLPLSIARIGEQVVIHGHFAKANPHWRAHENGGEILVIFQGAHAYISPAQYEATEAVPTWNYLAVHAYGEMHLLATGEETITTLEELFDSFDPSFHRQWQNLSEKYKSGMLNGIVAFEIVVTRLEGKAKLSQNRPVIDQANVAKWLLEHENQTEQEVGRLMQKNIQSLS